MSSPDRHARDERIRELNRMGWSNAQIGAEVGVSGPRISQILSAGADPDVLLAEREAALEAELVELNRHREANQRRLRVVRRALDRIAEEREARAIDRLLGLVAGPRA